MRPLIVGLLLLLAACGSPSASSTPSQPATPTASTAPTGTPSESALLDGFLAARVAGEGAEQYLNDPEVDIPLLYSTTSGAHYERAEFEQVAGVEWPYGWMGFKVRLFAGDTVVEQLLFKSGDGALTLRYDPNGFGTAIAPTTENGQPVAVPYSYFDGEVNLHAAHPWIFIETAPVGRLIPEGPGVLPTTDGGQRNGQRGPSSADAEALAESPNG